tara:strand:+ start:212 stop:511 length:300 start_codon:yes stop_codon:yes gene_type:complete
MGRKKELVASKSFTLGLQELVYLEKVCYEKNIKASKFINGLLRKAMLNDLEKEKQRHGPIAYCTSCVSYKEFEKKKGDKWLCIDCNEDKTDVIKYILEK